MKVSVRKKQVRFLPDEMRVINLNKAAVDELLWEHLMEYKSTYFDVDDVSEDLICMMKRNDIGGITYVIMPIDYLTNGCEPNFRRIWQKAGITTQSLFQGKRCRYQRMRITPDLLK